MLDAFFTGRGNSEIFVRYPKPPGALLSPVDQLNKLRSLNVVSSRNFKSEFTSEDIDSFMLFVKKTFFWSGMDDTKLHDSVDISISQLPFLSIISDENFLPKAFKSNQ
jgi:hypothetical protein